MVSQRKQLANQNNALKSTGPKTAEGKERASQNATTHGLLSKALIVAGEDAYAYESFRKAIFDDLQPKTAMETLLVEKIVSYAWRLRRAVQAEAIFFSTDWNLQTLDSFFNGSDAAKIQNISRYETTIEKHFYRAVKELREIQVLRRTKEKGAAFGFVS